MNHAARDFKKSAHDLIDTLPDDATWPDLIDRAAERQDMFEAAESNDCDDGRAKPDLRDYDRHLAEQGLVESER
jgi:hypothetical protein